MDERVKDLVDYTRDKWGLDNYYLHTHHFYRRLNSLNKTIYTLCMEWYPNHITKQEDVEYNPEGTAVVDLEVNSRYFESVIFVGDKSYSNKNVFYGLIVNDIIKWIENETGLCFGLQFHLEREEEREFYFRSSVKGVPVFPSGTINIKFDQEGKMTFFSVNGPFPSEGSVKEETFSIKLEDVEQLVKEQLKLIEFPSEKQKKFIPIYCIEEVYITNEKSNTIRIEDVKYKFKIDESIHWQISNKKLFKRRQINFNDNITAEQVFSNQPHPDLLPITYAEKEKCIMAVKDFLCHVFPKDSGKWFVKTLHREEGYILAILKVGNQDNRVFQRKLVLFIDANTFKVWNYTDNKPFIKMYKGYQDAESININKNNAYERIKSMIELKPVYVYDVQKNKYLLCGEIDSDFGINATNGKVEELNDFL